MQVLNSIRVPIAVLVVITAGCAPLPQGCLPIDSSQTLGLVQISIKNPGHYCLTENLHVRFEMADRWAERTLIAIRSDNVVLDLRGHYLTQNPNQRGSGIGIEIRAATNIHIKNGVVQKAKTGIKRSTKYPSMRDVEDIPEYFPESKVYRFPKANIVFENITFEDNVKNFAIEIQHNLLP